MQWTTTPKCMRAFSSKHAYTMRVRPQDGLVALWQREIDTHKRHRVDLYRTLADAARAAQVLATQDEAGIAA